MALREHLRGYLFVAPAVFVIFLFGLFPILYAFYMSLYAWRVQQGGFVGFSNYANLIGSWGGLLTFVAGIGLLVLAYKVWSGAFRAVTDRGLVVRLAAAVFLIGGGLTLSLGWGRMIEASGSSFLPSLPITLYYALGTVPVQIGLGLVLASLLFQKIRGRTLFRIVLFLPYVTPVVAGAVVFRTIFSPDDTGLVNSFLSYVGIGPQGWLFESRPVAQLLFGVEVGGLLAGPSLALVSIMIFGVWAYLGFNVVILLAGLSSVPNHLYEAAEIDGANGWHMFRHITLPMLSPVTYYLALIGFIGTMRAFEHIYPMRVASAQGSVDVASIVIFDTFYRSNQFGEAAAQAVLLFGIVAALTYVQTKVLGRKVFYE